MEQAIPRDEIRDLLSIDLENSNTENRIYEAVSSNVEFYNPYNDIHASKEKDEDDDEDIDDDTDDEEKKEGIENPFDREPTDKEIIENDLPFENPEDDLPTDDEDFPYN